MASHIPAGATGICANCGERLEWVQKWGMEQPHAFPVSWTDARRRDWYGGILRAQAEQREREDRDAEPGWVADGAAYEHPHDEECVSCGRACSESDIWFAEGDEPMCGECASVGR